LLFCRGVKWHASSLRGFRCAARRGLFTRALSIRGRQRRHRKTTSATDPAHNRRRVGTIRPAPVNSGASFPHDGAMTDRTPGDPAAPSSSAGWAGSSPPLLAYGIEAPYVPALLGVGGVGLVILGA